MNKSGKKRRKRKAGSKSRPLHRGVLPVVSAVAVLLIVGVYFGYQGYEAKKARLAYASDWEDADRQFSRRSLDHAGERYGAIAKRGPAVDAGLDDPDTVHQLAKTMADLCAAMEAEDLPRVVESLEKIESSPDELSFATDAKGVLTREQRLAELNQWASDRIDQQAADLNQHRIGPPLTVDNAKAIVTKHDAKLTNERLQSARKWRSYAKPLGGSTKLIGEAINAIAEQDKFIVDVEKFLVFVDVALKDLNEDDLKSAKFGWEELQSAFPKFARPELWSDYNSRLRKAFLNRLNAESPDALAQRRELGDLNSAGPSLLGLHSVAVLPDTAGEAELTDLSNLCFAKVHEHCYAIDSSTGRVVWALELGFDARFLPELVERRAGHFVHCVSVIADREAVSVLDARTGNSLWTRALPENVAFAGPPVAIGDHLYVLLNDGSLAALRAIDGRQVSLLQLPESTSSPMIVREDRQGVMIIGDKQGIYLVGLGANPKVNEVLFPERPANALFARGMWIPPFAIVFDNELTDTCDMKVFREQDGQYSLRQSETLLGRMWSDPAVVGADFLAVTDAGEEMIWHVDLDAPVNPLSVRYRRTTGTPFPQRPHFLSHPEAPFLSTLASSINCYWIDPLINQAQRKPQLKWEHQLPGPGSIVTQPLRISNRLVIVASQTGDRRRILVQGIAVDVGDVAWSVELGGAVTSRLVKQREAILRTDSGHLVHLAPLPGQRSHAARRAHFVHHTSARVYQAAIRKRVLPITSPDDRYNWIPQASAIVRTADPELRIQAVRFDGTLIAEALIADPLVSPIAVRAGEVTFTSNEQAGDSIPKTIRGVWCAGVDSRARLQVYRLGESKTDTSVVYYQIPGQLPGEWFRPVWLDANTILFAHPEGTIMRARLRHRSGVLSLSVAEQDRCELSALATSPLVEGDVICVALNSGDVVRRNADTFREDARVSLPAAPVSSFVSLSSDAKGDSLAIGMSDGRVAVLDSGAGLAVDEIIKLSETPLRLASKLGAAACFVDSSGTAFLLPPNLDGRSKQLGVPPLSVEPFLVGNDVVFATASGLWQTLDSVLATESQR